MALIARLLLLIAAPVTALVVARDAPNFGIVQVMVAIVLVVMALIVAATWPKRRKS